jgi:O-antigen/teichoic acid export membrane protein
MAGGLASKVLTGLANILIIKFLDKTDYAALANFQFIQTLMSGLIFSPFLLASVLGVNLFEMQNMRRLFSALNLIQIVLVMLCLLVALFYGEQLAIDLFHKPQFYYPILLGLISSIFLTFQNIMLSVHQASESYSSYNLINLLRPVFLILLLGSFYLTNSLNFITAASAFLLSYLLSVARDLPKIMEAISLKGLFFRLKQFVWFWKSLQYLILFFFLRAMLDHIARFMVSRYFSVSDNAAFGVSFQYYAMADLLIYSAHVAFMNIFTKEENAIARRKYMNWLRVTGLVSLAGIAVLMFTEPIFVLINGEQYRDAFPVFATFMAGITLYLCFSPVIYAIAQRRTFKTLFLLSLMALIWQLGMTWLAAEKQSLVMMAFACVSARGLIYLSSFFLYLRKA